MTAARDVQQSMFPDIVPDRPQGYIVPSVFRGTNADLMAAIAPYYLDGSVLDVTYGEGKWWDRFRPDPFVFHDLHKVDGVDFRALPHDDNSFDAVCFDPPYVIAGGRSTEALGDRFHDRYMIGVERLADAADLSELVSAGLAECCRVASRWVLVKCMEFAQGGGTYDFHDVPHDVKNWAQSNRWCTHDVIVHETGSGPGGTNIFTPKRARRHHSYLLVFRKGKP